MALFQTNQLFNMGFRLYLFVCGNEVIQLVVFFVENVPLKKIGEGRNFAYGKENTISPHFSIL